MADPTDTTGPELTVTEILAMLEDEPIEDYEQDEFDDGPDWREWREYREMQDELADWRLTQAGLG